MLNRILLTTSVCALAAINAASAFAGSGYTFLLESPDDDSCVVIAGDDRSASADVLLYSPGRDCYCLFSADGTPVRMTRNDDDTVSLEMEVTSYMDGKRGTYLMVLVMPQLAAADDSTEFRRNNLGLFTLNIGTTENLDVNGQGGSDVIIASIGLVGLVGLDLEGGEGNDLLIGGDGVDVLRGGAGNDVLIGGRGNDVVLGQDGDDLLLVNDGDGSEFGGWGNDLLNADDVMGDVSAADYEFWVANYGATTSEMVWLTVGYFEVGK